MCHTEGKALYTDRVDPRVSSGESIILVRPKMYRGGDFHGLTHYFLVGRLRVRIAVNWANLVKQLKEYYHLYWDPG